MSLRNKDKSEELGRGQTFCDEAGFTPRPTDTYKRFRPRWRLQDEIANIGEWDRFINPDDSERPVVARKVSAKILSEKWWRMPEEDGRVRFEGNTVRLYVEHKKNAKTAIYHRQSQYMR